MLTLLMHSHLDSVSDGSEKCIIHNLIRSCGYETSFFLNVGMHNRIQMVEKFVRAVSKPSRPDMNPIR